MVKLTAAQYIDYSRYMQNKEALDTLSALSQHTRLAAFRLLVQHEPSGLAAGELAQRLGVPQNTLSTHLGVLTRCGLLSSQRQSRTIIYRVRLDHLRELMLFLVEDCCGGQSHLRTDLLSALSACEPQP